MSALDCQKCGACCLAASWNSGVGGFNEPFAEVLDHEADAIEEVLPKSVTHVRPSGMGFSTVTMAMQVKQDTRGRCVALKGRVGCKVSCSVYEVRPSGCADFEPGSEKCLEIRRQVLGVTE